VARDIPKDRNGLAILVWLAASAGLYVVWVLIVVGLLEQAVGLLAREGVWRFAIFFLVVQIPQVLAVFLGAAATRLLVRPFNRMLLYYFSVTAMLIGSSVYALMLLWGLSMRGVVLAVLQFVALWLAWKLIKRVWNPTPDSVLPEADR
jgi:hypothetical protein